MPHRVAPDITINNINITPGTVLSSLRNLKSSNSVGPDGIPNILLKNCAAAICLPLCHIFDSSLKDGTLPVAWKIADVIPIHKKGCLLNPNNYRPISLTSNCCKLMEKIINKEILNYLLVNKLINNNQHGFISNRSTVTNLLESINDWT